ncbi:hypothetical protein GCM10025867_31200 [Frondihabitans sucicola]|uniref:Glycosyltransferase n=1 Tax=Frondihabitans sucicola TaxID=1268041 RepID=A0ABM8GQY7_9MICO|nr:hypothetical protein GCM10025867_31200 [Frondihabitans sucicola]
MNVVRRTKAYAAFAEDAVGISVSSHHEAALFLQHRIGSTSPKVIPLGARSVHASPGISSAAGSTGVEILMAGYVYPGKGHDEVLAAAAVLAGRDLGPIRLTVLGGAAPGHEAEARRLAARAGDTGVHFTVTGYLDRPSYESALAAPGVPVVAHLHYSASRSLLDWAEAGRKALVVGMRYTEEMAALRPGTLVLTESDPLSLADSIERLAGDRRATRLGPGVLLAPSLDDVAAVHLSWWANLPW